MFNKDHARNDVADNPPHRPSSSAHSPAPGPSRLNAPPHTLRTIPDQGLDDATGTPDGPAHRAAPPSARPFAVVPPCHRID